MPTVAWSVSSYMGCHSIKLPYRSERKPKNCSILSYPIHHHHHACISTRSECANANHNIRYKGGKGKKLGKKGLKDIYICTLQKFPSEKKKKKKERKTRKRKKRTCELKPHPSKPVRQRQVNTPFVSHQHSPLTLSSSAQDPGHHRSPRLPLAIGLAQRTRPRRRKR